MTESITLVSNNDPEKTAILNQMFDNLIVEAKFTLYAIFNTPGELSSLLFGDRKSRSATTDIKIENINSIPKRITRMKLNEKHIYYYLKTLGWKSYDINRTIKHLKEFSNELSKLS